MAEAEGELVGRAEPVADAVELQASEQGTLAVGLDQRAGSNRGVRIVVGQQACGGHGCVVENRSGQDVCCCEEDVCCCEEAVGGLLRLVAQLQDGVGVAVKGGVDEVDEGVEPDAVGDRQAAGGGRFGSAVRPTGEQTLRFLQVAVGGLRGCCRVGFSTTAARGRGSFCRKPLASRPALTPKWPSLSRT